MRGKRAGRGDGIAHRAEIARTATAERQPRQRPRKVRRAFQLLAQRLPQPRLAGEIGDGVETGVDGGGIGERAAEPARKLARAGAGDGAVDGGEQAAARAPWFERTSSRLARVAASMSSRLPGASLRGGRISGARPTCVIST